MSANVSDAYVQYEIGLEELLRSLGKQHTRYAEACTLQVRMKENLHKARMYGDPSDNSKERWELCHYLTTICMQELGINFSDLCAKIDSTSGVTAPDPPLQDWGYDYDIYLSYRCGSIYDNWIRNLFLKRLTGYLEEEVFEHRPRIYERHDKDTDPYLWPTQIALARSRCMIAICSPSYFQDRQCRYELAVMLKREQRSPDFAGYQQGQRVLLVKTHDGEWFPPRVGSREGWWDCNDLASPSVIYTARGVELDETIRYLAKQAATSIRDTPSWRKEILEDLKPDEELLEELSLHHQIPLPRW